jgi:cytochrome c oxidase subunit 3
VSATAPALAGGSNAGVLAETFDRPLADTEALRHAGADNAWLGIVLFIVSEAVMFGAFFAQYFYERVLSPTWPNPTGLPPGFEGVPAAPIALILTVVLVASGFTAHAAQTAIARDDRDAFTGWLIVTIVLGAGFLSGQAYEYLSLLTEGFNVTSGIYGSIFFCMTGLHGIHVLAGVSVLTFVVVRGFLGHFSSSSHFGVQGSVLYWHFVDVVWLALYGALYLL